MTITLQPRPTVQLGDYYGPEPRKLAAETVDDVNLVNAAGILRDAPIG